MSVSQHSDSESLPNLGGGLDSECGSPIDTPSNDKDLYGEGDEEEASLCGPHRSIVHVKQSNG